MGYTQHSNPFSRRSSSPLNKTWDEAYQTRDMDTYGEMDRSEYIKEAKRQAGLYKQSGGTIKDGIATGGTWDYPSAPITESKNETNKELFTNTPKITSASEKSGKQKSGKQKRAEKKAKRIQKRIDKMPFGKDARPGQEGRLAKAEAKAAGKSGKEARQIAKDTRKRARRRKKGDIF